MNVSTRHSAVIVYRMAVPGPNLKNVNVVWKPQTLTPVEGDKAETLMKLIATLEDDDDVQNVYANFDVDEAALGQLSAA